MTGAGICAERAEFTLHDFPFLRVRQPWAWLIFQRKERGYISACHLLATHGPIGYSGASGMHAAWPTKSRFIQQTQVRLRALLMNILFPMTDPCISKVPAR